jgi:hypothetical protein
MFGMMQLRRKTPGNLGMTIPLRASVALAADVLAESEPALRRRRVD